MRKISVLFVALFAALINVACGKPVTYYVGKNDWLEVFDQWDYANKQELENVVNMIEDSFPALPKKKGGPLYLEIVQGPFWDKDNAESDNLIHGGYYPGQKYIRVARERPWQCWGSTGLAHELMHWYLEYRKNDVDKDLHIRPEWRIVDAFNEAYILEYCKTYDLSGHLDSKEKDYTS